MLWLRHLRLQGKCRRLQLPTYQIPLPDGAAPAVRVTVVPIVALVIGVPAPTDAVPPCHGYIVLNSFPKLRFTVVLAGNGNLIANHLFNTANAPSLELLTGRSSEAVCRKRVFAGNTGHICHCACTAVSRKEVLH